jgi:hypothetical protein
VLLVYFRHPDHNVVTASLEAFHQLLKHTPLSLRNALVKHDVLAAIIKQQSPGNYNFGRYLMCSLSSLE